ncbi:MAG: hypothetical protein F6K56_00730 [Moorea sp. SIO3G5]|nr:hypothetical protein [Moorena sp. SIO3G5]
MPTPLLLIPEFSNAENTAKKSKKIRVFLNPEQRLAVGHAMGTMVRQWFGVSRYVFNKTVKILSENLKPPQVKIT